MSLNELRKLQSQLDRAKGKQEHIQQMLGDASQKLKETKQDIRRHEQAMVVVKEVGLKTQQTLQYHIADTVSMALDSVFPDPYTMSVEFVQRRGKTECDLFFERGKNSIDPLSASGGGAVDVASFALRVASWSMQYPRTRNVLLLDEPFKNLSEGLLPKASEMLKQVSSKLGLQIVMITHETALIESADKVFEIRNKKRRSTIQS